MIAEKPGKPSANGKGLPGFELRIEARGLDDIRALGSNSVEDEREFAAVARVSEVNNALYQSFLQPWVRAVSSPQLARAFLEMNPLRLSYALWSDKNPMMRLIAPLATQAKTERTVPSAENPLVGLQQEFSKTMINALNAYGDARDKLTEQVFHAIYGSPVVQAACGIAQKDAPPRPRPGLSPSTQATIDREIRRLKDRVAVGGPLEAITRAIVYIGESEHHVGENTFDALRRLLLAHPKVSPAEFKGALRDQWAIVHLDERTAIETFPRLLPSDSSERRAVLDAIKSIVTATTDLSVEGQRRRSEIIRLFESGSRRTSTTREKVPDVAAE